MKIRKREFKTRTQINALEKLSQEYEYPSEYMIHKLAVSVWLTKKQVSGWFFRRRKKDSQRKQLRSSFSIQDSGSGLRRQDSCGSTKQGENSQCEPQEVESKCYSGQDFPAAYPADEQMDSTYKDMDDRSEPSADPTAAAKDAAAATDTVVPASFSDEEIFQLLKISKEAFKAKLGITNSFLEEACTKLFLGFVKLFLTLSERSPNEVLQKALDEASDLSKVGLPMDSFKQQLELIKRTKDDFDAQAKQVEQTRQTLTEELSPMKVEMEALQEKQYMANEVLRACPVPHYSVSPVQLANLLPR